MDSKTLPFFEEISKIPRESGNEENIVKYIAKFAEDRNLEYITDKYNNIIIKKYINNTQPLILQAHLDMVCEKEDNSNFDFSKEGLELIYEDNYLKANKTTLGADNGIGVAQILNILDKPTKINIEAIFTSNEETSMSGAMNIDLNSLKGKKMINLDGFNSDTILLESASFSDIDINTNYQKTEKATKNLYKIKISGLEGGHSGFDISKNKGNAISLLAEILLKIDGIKISEFTGGSKINVIPSTAQAIIETKKDINKVIKEYQEEKQRDYPKLKIEVSKELDKRAILTQEDTNLFLSSIYHLKHGIINKNNRDEVTTSQNLALVDLSRNLIQIGLRSSQTNEESCATNLIKEYCKNYNYKFNLVGHQPGFCTTEDKELVKNMRESYYKLNNKYPEMKSVHISVEVGLIKEKIKDLEVVIISPEIVDAHTPNEKVKISSIIECDKWLEEYIKIHK